MRLRFSKPAPAICELDVAIFLILRFTGMRRESVATLRTRNLALGWGLRGVVVKGGKTRDIPLPSVVTQYLEQYVEQVVAKENGLLTPDTPIFWSSWGRPRQGKARSPMSGKNIWRLCKTYGRLIGCSQLEPRDLRHGVAMEVYAQHHDLEQSPSIRKGRKSSSRFPRGGLMKVQGESSPFETG